MGNASGVRDKTLRRFAAAAVLDIPVDEMVTSPWSAMRDMIYENEDETIIPKFKAAKKLLRRKKTYMSILEFVGTGELAELVNSTTETPAKAETEKPASKPRRTSEGNAKQQSDKDAIKEAMKNRGKS